MPSDLTPVKRGAHPDVRCAAVAADQVLKIETNRGQHFECISQMLSNRVAQSQFEKCLNLYFQIGTYIYSKLLCGAELPLPQQLLVMTSLPIHWTPQDPVTCRLCSAKLLNFHTTMQNSDDMTVEHSVFDPWLTKLN